MRILTHTVTAQEDGATVKHLLRQRFALSSSLLKSIKWREGGITLNGVPVTVTALCHAGDRLAADVSDSPSQNPNLHPIDFPLSILWEDEDLLILNKPAGITVHCAALTQEPVTVAGAVAHYLNSDQYHGVNRLDRGTTGVMVVAKSGYIHARCMALLHSGDFYREYRGICLGTPEPISGHIDLPIDRDRDSLLKRHIDPQGAPAHTDYEVLAQRNGLSLLRLVPRTGRTHQLRLHMAEIGHPLAGDWLYGTEDKALIPRPALHSYAVHLRHPGAGHHRSPAGGYAAALKVKHAKLAHRLSPMRQQLFIKFFQFVFRCFLSSSMARYSAARASFSVPTCCIRPRATASSP